MIFEIYKKHFENQFLKWYIHKASTALCSYLSVKEEKHAL